MHRAIRQRYDSWEEIFWKKGVGVIAAAYSVFALWDFVKSELLPEHYQSLTIVKMTPHLSWRTWVIVVLLIGIAVLLEGAHAAIQKRNTALAGIAPKLKIMRHVHEQPLANRAVTYYIDVVNESIGTTVMGVEVKVTAIKPPAVKWIIPLHIKHDNRPEKRTEFDLNPQDTRQIDLVYGGFGLPTFQIVDVISDSSATWTNLPSGRYTLTVTASGRDVPKAEAKFDVWRDDTGYLRCEAQGE